MSKFTDNPNRDAQDYSRERDARFHEYDYSCDFCGLGFDSGCGGEIADLNLDNEPDRLLICTPCEISAEHIKYLRGKVEEQYLNQIEIKQI